MVELRCAKLAVNSDEFDSLHFTRLKGMLLTGSTLHSRGEILILFIENVYWYRLCFANLAPPKTVNSGDKL